MILLSRRNRLAVAFLVSAAVVVLSCSFGGDRARAQSTVLTDSAARARQAAKDWALKIFDEIGQRPNEDKRVTFQPLDDRHVASSRHRRRLYGWMLSALHERGRVWKYSVMNPMDSRHVAEALKQAGVQDWQGIYVRTLQRHSLTNLNLSCDAILDGNRIKLECTALNIHTHKAWGRATAVFDMDWLGAPLAMEQALDAVAGEVVAGLGGSGRVGEIKIVDHRTESGSALTRSIERSLEVRVVRRLRAKGRGWSSVGTATKQDEPYRLEGGVEHHNEKLVLRVKVYLNDDLVNAVEEHITLASVPKNLLEAGRQPWPAKPSGGVASSAKGAALHEAVQAGDIDGVTELLAAGADVNGRDGRSWTGLMHAATRGYTLVVELLLRAGADSGIRAVDGATALFMASARGHLEIVTMLLKADADPDVMGPRGMRAAEAAAEGGHPRIVGLLKAAKEERAAYAKARRLDTVAAYDAFLEKYREGPRAEGARRRRAELLESHNELDNKAYARARALDTVKAYEAYLAEYPDGRHAGAARNRIRTLDDEAYARARALDTVKAYEAYLAEYPDGRHAGAARKRIRTLDDEAYARARRLDTVEAYEAYLAAFPKGIHAQEARERKWQSVEAVLGLEQADRVAIQRGLVSMGKDVGAVDGVFGKRTRRAIREWQREKGMAVTGYLTREQAEALKVLGEAVMQREAAQAAEAVRVAEAARAARAAEAARLEQQKKERERLRPGREFRDCAECPEMVVVRKGEYMMGSPGDEKGRYDDEGPRRRVTIPYVFAVGRYEITAEEFGRFVRETGHDTSGGCRYWERGWKGDKERSWSDPGYPQTGRDPVVCVSWKDAKGYLKWLREKTGKEYRLLSEAEWEYVTRGGSTTRYWWGDLIGEGKANCKGCRSGWDGKKTAPVKSFEANAFGLYGVHGNVWEWMEDCWHDTYNGAPTDGSAWVSSGECGQRVLRSGSWLVEPKNLRSAVRYRNSPGVRNYSYGFRVARTLSP